MPTHDPRECWQPATPATLQHLPCPRCGAPVVAAVDPQGHPLLLDELLTTYAVTPAQDSQGRYPVVRAPLVLIDHQALCRQAPLGDTLT